jgi:hypothetical protein
MQWVAKVRLQGGQVRYEGPLSGRPAAERYRAYQLETFGVEHVDLMPVYKPDAVPRWFRRSR